MTPEDLKTSILLYAVQGKLVKQLEDENPVNASSSYCGEKSELFDIPENWKWLALKDVVNINTGLAFKKQDQKTSATGSLRILRGGNVGDDYKYHLFDNDIYVDINQFRDKFIPLQVGDVITPSVTSMEKMCKTGFIDKVLDNTTAGGFVYIIRSLDIEVLDPKYLLYFISSAFNKEQCKPNIHKSGQAFYNLKKSGFVEQPICVPPIKEQHRIVAKIEEILPFVDRYAEAYEKLEKFNAKFPEDMKKSILQYAIQGKLVEQRPEEGSAEDLFPYLNIDKKLVINEEPFDIPDSWRWIPIGNLGASLGTDSFADGPFGSNLKTAHYINEPEVRIIQLSNIGEEGWKDRNIKYTSIKHLEEEIPRCEVHPGDFVIAKMMPAGRTIEVPELGTRITLGSDAMKFVPNPILDKQYLLWAMRSQVFIDQVYADAHGITRVRTTLKGVKSYLLPIPPIEEQHRIVAKIEELLPYCDAIK